jgi:hypothetical protein
VGGGDDRLCGHAVSSWIAESTALFEARLSAEVAENHRQASGSAFDGVQLKHDRCATPFHDSTGG